MATQLVNQSPPLISSLTRLIEELDEASLKLKGSTKENPISAVIAEARQCLEVALKESRDLEVEGRDYDDSLEAKTTAKKEAEDLQLSKMPPKQREAAIRRAKNREAARRSRQRKNERINNLYKDLKALQQENVVILKCIEEFAQRALEEEEEPTQIPVPATATAMVVEQKQPIITGKSSPTGTSRMASLMLPPLEDLPRTATAPGQVTARDTLSARAALAEQLAILSRDNSPRDEEIVGATTNGQQQPQQQQKVCGDVEMADIQDIFQD